MKVFLMSLLLISKLVLAGSIPQPSDEEFMRFMQAKAEQAQQEEEFKNPKNPEMGADRAVVGKRTAPLKVFVYSDFQCPYCKKGFDTVEELKKRYGQKMVFMFKHLPLPFHPLAMPAAKRFEAVALQSPKKAYAFHDEVFKNQAKLAEGEAFLDEVVKKVGADLEKVKKDIESPKVLKRIEADQSEAKKYGIQGTPGFVVAGITVRGAYPIEAFEEIIQKRLGESLKKN